MRHFTNRESRKRSLLSTLSVLMVCTTVFAHPAAAASADSAAASVNPAAVTAESASSSADPAAAPVESVAVSTDPTDAPADPAVPSEKRKLIIDTDTAADDASAIILAAKNADIDLLGVTILAGNVDLEQGAKNALMALELAGAAAPVYKGSDEFMSGKKIEAISVYGKDGLGDADLAHPKGEPEEQDGVSFILDMAKKYSGELEIIALGPATNIANAIVRDPETMKQVKRIWSMGTAGLGPGNASPVAEFNVFADPEAYKTMLDSGIDITIVGYDMCKTAMWSDHNFNILKGLNEIGSFIYTSFGTLRSFYSLNRSENAVTNCDALAMTCALYPGFVRRTIPCHGSCITEPGETRGEVIFYQKGMTYDAVPNDFDYNVELVSELDSDVFFYIYLYAIE